MDDGLGANTKRIIAKFEIIVSVTSVWEMQLKNSRGKLPLPQDAVVESLVAQGFVMLPILSRHIEAVSRLSCVHADPFDRC